MAKKVPRGSEADHCAVGECRHPGSTAGEQVVGEYQCLRMSQEGVAISGNGKGGPPEDACQHRFIDQIRVAHIDRVHLVSEPFPVAGGFAGQEDTPMSGG